MCRRDAGFRRAFTRHVMGCLVGLGFGLGPGPGTIPAARAAVDIFDRGPALTAGRFNLRVSNAGLVGNPFPDLSYDPSFEYPRGSGQELMRYAALWVGALNTNGTPRVSGGPLLEFRPTLAPEDTVRSLWHGRFASRRAVDDDGDGQIDEETYNDRDDDGDGEIDEDLGLIGQQMTLADYTDDQPEAVNYQPGSGETHQPLGLTVHQEAYAWTWPGYDGIAGLQFRITNHGGSVLRDVYVGLYVDLDARRPADAAGHSNDAIQRVAFSRSFSKGTTRVFVDGQGMRSFSCFNRAAMTVPLVVEPPGLPPLPVAAVLPLDHTNDPLDLILPGFGRAPGRDGFTFSVFAGDRAFGSGGPPVLDLDRYAAMKGEWAQSPDSHIGDQQILVSCGPFRVLAPGQSLDFAVALVAASGPDSLRVALGNAAFLHNGTELNLVPDDTGPHANWWTTGPTGINGHEACIEAPPGLTFQHDPHCSLKFGDPPLSDPPRTEPAIYRPGTCIWSDADCDVCTGMNGRETIVRWVDLLSVPPSPGYRITPGDHRARIEWDNLPEILVRAGRSGPPNGTFIGYRLYRLSNWEGRGSLLPPRENWEALATFGYDSVDSKRLLSSVTDSTLDFLRIWYEQKHYPIGRYAYVDSQPLNGFDYAYLVTSIVETLTPFAGFLRVNRYESPLSIEFDQRVVPREEARGDAMHVWVVPNPFRARAEWDRPPVYGDRLTRHLDFMGLPRARSTIRIWTVAGDLVATVEHDGSAGSGQASWNLVTRNGQEAASGVYLYTVESSLGNSTGRFVVIR